MLLSRRLCWSSVTGLFVVVLVGCAGLPVRDAVLAPVTHAVSPSAASRLGATAADAVSRSGADSAFTLLPLSAAAYDIRLELAHQAERTLDMQTFVLNDDETTSVLLRSLRDAASRGVRVRLLVDDLYSDQVEGWLSDLAAFDGVEVRLVNPFTRLRGSLANKLLSSLDEIDRVNHRMHNKLLVADNALALFGGRNIANEYFLRSTSGDNFIDLEVLAAGNVVPQLSAGFDSYWNSSFAWPIDAIVVPRVDRMARRTRFKAEVGSILLPPTEPPPQRLVPYAAAAAGLRRGALELQGAPATVIVDPVDKLAGTRVGQREGTVRALLGAAGLAAQDEVITISPYFIPGRIGMESLRQNQRDGARLRLYTNSLAATDEPAAHAAYVAIRKDLLALGMEIYELSPSFANAELRTGRYAPGVLHMKAFVIDRRFLLVGSMNLDGRSEQFNTEVGVMIDSPELVDELLAAIRFEPSSYRVELTADGSLRWTNERRGQRTVSQREPEASLWHRARSTFLGWIIPHDWL